jgi:hypothetical protein
LDLNGLKGGHGRQPGSRNLDVKAIKDLQKSEKATADVKTVSPVSILYVWSLSMFLQK